MVVVGALVARTERSGVWNADLPRQRRGTVIPRRSAVPTVRP